MASYVPWLVWRDSCGKFISTLLSEEQQNRNVNNNSENQNQDQQHHEQGTAEQDRQVPTNENNANSNSNSSIGTKIEELINERVVADFLLPTIVTALLLLLATGAEDKDPNNFLSFIAIAAHAVMAYFLYFSMKDNLTKSDGEREREQRAADAREEA